MSLDNKLEKVLDFGSFSGVSDENFTIEFRRKLESLYNQKQLIKLFKDINNASDGKTDKGGYTGTSKDLYDSLFKLINNRVVKQNGKGLSTHDFTTDLKEKLERLRENVTPPAPVKEPSLCFFTFSVRHNTLRLKDFVNAMYGSEKYNQNGKAVLLSGSGRVVLTTDVDEFEAFTGEENTYSYDLGAFTCTYQKADEDSVIEFVSYQSSASNLEVIYVDGVQQLNGRAGSTATVTRIENKVFVRISNAPKIS